MQCTGKYSKKLLLTFVCLMTMLLTACGSNAGFTDSTINPPAPTVVGTPKATDAKQIYHASLISPDLDIDTFDPALVGDVNSTQAIDMVFNGLVSFDDELNVQPELATWEQSQDGLQWTFHLRPNLLFSDGTPLTSQDVAYSIDRALQPTTNQRVDANGKRYVSQLSIGYLGLIKDADKLFAGNIKTIIGDSILTPNANTVVLQTTKRASYFLRTLTYPTSYVVEKKLVDKYGSKFTDHLTEGGEAGPFIVSQYTHKQEIDLVPNPYYYNFKPILKVIYRFIKTGNESYQAYQNGELDITSVPFDRVDEAKQTGEYIQRPYLAIYYVAMNFLTKPFDNIRIRQAFALSIQRDRLRYDIFKDTVVPTYHIIPEGMAEYSGSKLVGPFNVQDTNGNSSKAQQLFQEGLQQEGWSGVTQIPPIKLTYSADPTNDQIINMMIQMWHNVLGVNVTPNPVNGNVLYAEVDQAKNNPQGLQMWFLGWSADYPDPQDWTTIFFDKGASYNSMNYGQNNSADANQEQLVQTQLEQADVETDLARRVLDYQNAEQRLVDQVAWLPLYQATRRIIVKPYVQGLTFNAIGVIPPTDWANIYIAQH